MQQPLKVRLAHRQRQASQILTAQRQHVEGAELHLGIVLAVVQRVEIGDPVDAGRDRLASVGRNRI
ncbi:hypothetical protein [Bradyrhizobium jicamae]|uniref:hypothetical protein n=1 Tax=Bradyrhizobium jicamae TaxID=280332 RepID=UPI001BADF282|nr:hypothetical protein [Bradyrhizobium jicamae]